MGLDKGSRKEISSYIREMSSVTIEEVCDLIRPRFTYDVEKLVENEIAKTGRGIISSIKDKKGVREILSEEKGVFINIVKTENIISVRKTKKQLDKKYVGLRKTRNKVIRREKKLAGQMNLFDMENDIAEDESAS